MTPASANPLLHEIALLEGYGLTPDLLEDQSIQLPSFWQVLKWMFGKPLNLLTRKGLEAKKVDLMLVVLDQKRTAESEQAQQMESDMRRNF